MLPGAAVHAVAGLQAGPVAAAGPSLRPLAQRYEEARATVSTPLPWAGAGADAFAAHRAALPSHLADGAESLNGRLDATADYAEALADWITLTRAELARALAEVLCSAQAVCLVTGGSPAAGPGTGVEAGVETVSGAAADVAVHVLAPLVTAYERGEDLRREWAPRLAELPLRAPTGTDSAPGGTMRLGW